MRRPQEVASVPDLDAKIGALLLTPKLGLS